MNTLRSNLLIVLLFPVLIMAQPYQLSRQQFLSAGGPAGNAQVNVRHEFGLSHLGSMSNSHYKLGLATRIQILTDESAGVPAGYALEQNYPNPFNQSTRIAYDLPRAGSVRMVLYSILGKQVRVLYDGRHSAGRFVLRYDGLDSMGQPLPSGLYFLSLRAGEFQRTIKLSILR